MNRIGQGGFRGRAGHSVRPGSGQTHLNPNRERTLHDGAYLFPTDWNLCLSPSNSQSVSKRNTPSLRCTEIKCVHPVRRQVQSLQYSYEVIYMRLFFLGSLTEAPLRID
ncbi:MAG: hypothetical protein JRD87_01160 [Deltaproteobacteria bacterium]|nr:hypothetical protein [Deltaproteobacteria bacterium]MBW2668492.1 hypothetical protein [Deltaproteobacteria bacterium]